MGQLIGNLTNPAVVSPNGQTQFFSGAPQAGMAMARQAAQTAQPSTANIGANGPTFDNPQPQQPRMVRPSFLQAANSGPGGTPDAMSPGLTKMGKLAVLFTQGAKGALAGRAAQEQTIAATGGRRAGGVGTGFAAGYSQPFQEAEQRQQAQLGQAGLQPIPLPGGVTVPAAMAPKFLSPYLGYQGKIGAAQIGATGKEQAAQTEAQGRLQGEQIKAASQEKIKRYTAVPGVGLFDTQTQQVMPGTQQGVTITPEIASDYGLPNDFVGKPMNVSQLAQVEKAQTMRAGTTTNSVEYKEDVNGNIVALPKTTTRKPNLPGAGTAAAPATPAQPSNGSAPRSGPVSGFQGKNSIQMVQGTDQNGRQVAGTPQELRQAGVSNFTKMPENNATQVVTARTLTSKGGLFDMVDNDLKQFSPDELNGLSNRWQEFLTGTFGADDRYINLRTHLNGLTGTALMQAHVGSRGGEHMMDHFADLADAHKFNYSNLKTAVDAERQYVQERAMRPTAKAAAGGGDPFAQFGGKAR